ncbi:MAG: CoA-binding protein, partial [Promethearchaeota archaeon]
FNKNKLYLINSSKEEIFGLKCYKSFEEIPENTIDHLILAVGRNRLIQNLKMLLKQKKQIKTIHIFTAGTGESDKEGLEIEKEIKKILNDNSTKTRAIGPNCMGVYSTRGHLAYEPSFPIEPGNISLVFQSGDLHSQTIRIGSKRYGLRFSKGVSIGNCVDLQISDFLRYYNEDDDTDIIGVYFEGFSQLHSNEGKKFLNTLRNMKKPLLFMNGTNTKRAQTAALTHTGSIGTNRKIWKAIISQTPIIEVPTSLDDMIDYLYLFYEVIKRSKNLKRNNEKNIYPQGKNVLLILWSGGFGIIDTNILTELGLNVPYFEGEILEKLRKIYPIKIGSLSNPLDLPWIGRTPQFVEIARTAILENIDLVIIESNVWDNFEESEIFKSYYKNLLKIKNFTESLNKILILILPQYPSQVRQKYYDTLVKDDFIVYPSVRRAANAFLALYQYGKKIKNLKNN